MLELIITQIAIWAPSLISILSVVAVILTAMAKTNGAINELRSTKDFSTLKEQNIQLQSKLDKLLLQNEELIEANKILIDKITGIDNYVDNARK